MSGQNSHFRSATWGAALGAYGIALTRAGAQLLDDVQLQQTAAIGALAVAMGPCLGLIAGGAAGTVEVARRAARTRAWWSTLAAAALLGGACAWLRWARGLPPTDIATCGAALLLALPLCLASYASHWGAVAPRAELAAWLVGAALGACAAQLGIEAIGAERVLAEGCLVAALAALLAARPPAAARGDLLWLASGITFIAALIATIYAPTWLAIAPQPGPLGELAALRERLEMQNARLSPREDAWDALGHLQTFEIVDPAQHTTGLGVLLRDSAVVAPIPRAETSSSGAGPSALCSGTLVAEPYTEPRARVLLAGLGGGLELQCARAHAATSIDVAEPSRALLRLLRGPLVAWLGGAERDPRVRFHATSAREIARTTVRGKGFDLIAVASSATKHRLPAGVLPIPVAESAIITDRGLSELVAALAPDGVLFAVVAGEPAALRFANTALAALRLRGVQKPENAIVIHESAGVYGIQVKRSGFALDEVLAMHARNRERGEPHANVPLTVQLWPWSSGRPQLRYTPGAGFDNRFGALFARASQPEPAPFQATYLFDLRAASDDRPLFYENTRGDRSDAWQSGSPYRGLLALALTVLLVSLALAMLAWSAGGSLRRDGTRRFASLFCLGAAQPFALAIAIQRPSLLEPERAGVLALLGMSLGAALGLKYCPSWIAGQPRRSRALAWAIFTLMGIGLGPALSVPYVSSPFVNTASFGVAALVGCVLSWPSHTTFAAAATVHADRSGSATRIQAVALLAFASTVPLTSALTLWAGTRALCIAGSLLLALTLLLAPGSERS